MPETKQTVKKTGRHYFKDERVHIESNDFHLLAEILHNRRPPSFEDMLRHIIGWCGGILETNGIPATLNVWKDEDGQWGAQRPPAPLGIARIDVFVEKHRGYNAGSIVGLASRAFATASEIQGGGEDLSGRSFYLGMLVERLVASLYLDKRTETTNQKKTEWKPAAIALYHELVEDGKIDLYGKVSEAARTLKRNYEKLYGKIERSLRTWENLIREIHTSKKV